MSTTQHTSRTPARNWLALATGRNLAYLMMLLGAAALAVTGLGWLLFGKAAITGWVLMLHVGSAPLFAVGLALVALTWAGRSGAGAGGLLFWLVLAGGWMVLLTGVVPMTPLCGTDGQRTLASLHRYSAIVLTAVVALHLLRLAAVNRRSPGA
ncbi:MAG: hypothetical protein NT105_04390 [Verrucomicrobia bacterium]|nr:hypothetical protein [Verrucomicrobiota bacterium]